MEARKAWIQILLCKFIIFHFLEIDHLNLHETPPEHWIEICVSLKKWKIRAKIEAHLTFSFPWMMFIYIFIETGGGWLALIILCRPSLKNRSGGKYNSNSYNKNKRVCVVPPSASLWFLQYIWTYTDDIYMYCSE